jgi:cytochrome c
MIGRVAAVMMAAVAGAAVLSAQPPAARTVWDGVYSAPQARRGEQVFKSECSYCHRDDLSGGFFDGGALPAPALAGPRAFGSSFVERWQDLSVGEMVATIASAMPQQKPASLTLQQYVDVVSYLFERNDVPAGPSELAVDVAALGVIFITARR